MSMPPVDEGQTMLESDMGNVPWFDPPDRPISAPPFLEPPDRPISAPPVLEPDGSNLFAFQASTTQDENQDMSHQNILGPKGANLFAYQASNPKLSSRPPMPTSPPPQSPSPALRDRSVDSGLHRSPSIPENRSCSADLFGQHDIPWGKLENDIERRCTPPPATLSSHMDVSPNHPGLSTPPPQAGFGSPGPHTPGLCMPGSGSGDYGPALLHPGTVRAFDPIDRPISAPPSLDPGSNYLAMMHAAYSSMAPADIRCDDSYNEFFQIYQEQNVNLPPPLDPIPDLLRTKTRPATDLPVPENTTDGTADMQTSGLAVASFGPATGFQDAPVLQTQPTGHVGHLPRSPSPPWESSNTASPGNPVSAAQLAQQYAQQSLHAQYAQFRQQQMPPPLGGSGDAALRHSTLLGPAGYPGPANSEGIPYHWQFGQPGVLPPGMQMGTAAQLLQGKGGVHSQALLGGLQPSRLQGLPLTSIGTSIGLTGNEPQFDDAQVRSNHLLGPVDLSKRPREIGVEVAPGAGRGQRSTLSVTSNVVPGIGGNTAATAAAVAAAALTGVVPGASPNNMNVGSHVAPLNREWDQQVDKNDKKNAPRPNFKLSQLEDIFASNAFLQSVYPIAKDQAGCRMLQHKLDEGNPEVTNSIFIEVLTHCVELMMDPFGNYLCQKLMDLCNHRQLELILDKVCADLVRISLNMHGARAVQKLIDAVRTTPHVLRLTRALEGAVVALTKDPNGNHVVQRCLEVLPVETRSFIFRAAAADIVEVGSHRHGCRIVQRCIDASQGQDRHMLVVSICSHALLLVQDAFGNYVVQYVLGLRDAQATAHIIHCLFGRLHILARQKFSSNVIERCLQLTGPEDRHRMLLEIADPRGIGELLRDVYGNYVVQSALSLANEQQLQIMLDYIRPVLPSLRSSGQGRRIAQKLEKKYPQLRVGGGDSNTGVRKPVVHQAGSVGNAIAQVDTRGMGSPSVGLIGSQDLQVAPGAVPRTSMQGVMPGLLGIAPVGGPMQLGSVVSNDTIASLSVGLPGSTPQVANAVQSAGSRGGGKQKKGRKKDM